MSTRDQECYIDNPEREREREREPRTQGLSAAEILLAERQRLGEVIVHVADLASDRLRTIVAQASKHKERA
jgi:hypothetical protein